MKVFAVLAIIASFFVVKYRERLGDILGDPEWADSIGGIYMLCVIGAFCLFFWGVIVLTGTSDVLMMPLIRVLPGFGR